MGCRSCRSFELVVLVFAVTYCLAFSLSTNYCSSLVEAFIRRLGFFSGIEVFDCNH